MRKSITLYISSSENAYYCGRYLGFAFALQIFFHTKAKKYNGLYGVVYTE